MGLSTAIVVDDVQIDLSTQYGEDSFSFAARVSGSGLDLATVVKNRFNGLNVVLPAGSSIPVAQISGSISKEGQNGEDRKLAFSGAVKNISLPIPLLTTLTINQGYLFYEYLSKAPTQGKDPDYSGQVISIGCDISLSGDLSSAVQQAEVTGAYFISDNATLVYLNFAGTLNIGNILSAIFSTTFPNLTINIQSAGLFRMAKKNETQNTTGQGSSPKTNTGLTYTQALQQISQLQPNAATPTGKAGALMPPSFPLSNMPQDFTQQFTQAFSSDQVTGISFWAIMDFGQISLFNSMLTIGYSGQMNNITIYGFRTQTETQKTPAQPTNSALFASFPTFTLLNIFKFSGNNGRENILFQYTSNQDQYELSGSVEFAPFTLGTDKPSFTFQGDLTVNNTKLLASLELSTGSSTQTVDAPFGMTGINFGQLTLDIDHTFAQTQPKAIPASTDLIINGQINLEALENNLILQGTIIFEKSEPRLALVSLTANPVLTIYDFVVQVIQKPWQWVDDITKAIGLVSGSMYYLKCPSGSTAQQCSAYTFQYPPSTSGNGTSTSVTYKEGYHLDAVLQFFEEYNFQIDLDVESDGIELSGTYIGTPSQKTTTLTVYFIQLTAPTLTIKTTNGQKTFEVSVQNLTLFGTDIGNFTMDYSNGIFSGSYQHQGTPSITIDWQWTKGDFSITSIDGLGTQEIQDAKAIENIVNQLNKLGGNGCQDLVNSMFNNEVKTTFSLSLTSGQKPSQVSTGIMQVPLTVSVELTIAGQSITTVPVDFEIDFSIPTSLDDLPKAIWDTATNPQNLELIFQDIISNPKTYEAIALVAAKKVSASIAARILCKTKDEDLAEALEEALEAGEIAGDLGAVLELDGVVVAVIAAAAAATVASFLSKIWDTIKSWFGGGDSEKKKAEDQVNQLINKVKPLLSRVQSQLTNVATNIQIEKLTVGIDGNGNFVAAWDFPQTALGENSTLLYQLSFLSGAVGDHTQTEEPGLPATGFQLMPATQQYTKPWAAIQEAAPSYTMNAAVQSSITGYTFLTPQTKTNLQTAVSNLQSVESKVDSGTRSNIQQFVNTVNTFISTMDGYNTNGLTSDIVYAQLNNTGFEVGQAALGINTTISS
ncbi:MAG: hypothetical protein CMI35_02580 [Owenweeksia sp.]|nr:hypothetical protein [Owenweeksia sp.]